jgi:hypothetical protein
VICRQKKSAIAIRLVLPDYPNLRRVTKQQFHQQRCNAIGNRMEK